ncbi:hypothetical protein DPMN_040894 [Dreissena polymorpha]|uniref:Uncharacterized protein n=1 Tax=Dreissena polymorpha TaxID=45954 RepID=A0A9D4HVL7_DREPO|nr:hypothetical protein DPMN_040894 [Dreissena polymorpha]
MPKRADSGNLQNFFKSFKISDTVDAAGSPVASDSLPSTDMTFLLVVQEKTHQINLPLSGVYLSSLVIEG